MQKWEYLYLEAGNGYLGNVTRFNGKILNGGTDKVITYIAQLGTEGWEMMYPTIDRGQCLFVFKRPLE